MRSSKPTKHRWKKAQIRAARKVELAPLLSERGILLQPLSEENFCGDEHVKAVTKLIHPAQISDDLLVHFAVAIAMGLDDSQVFVGLATASDFADSRKHLPLQFCGV